MSVGMPERENSWGSVATAGPERGVANDNGYSAGNSRDRRTVKDLGPHIAGDRLSRVLRVHSISWNPRAISALHGRAR